MFPSKQYSEPPNPTSSLPAHPRTPAHSRVWTNITRAKADDIMMALTFSQKPQISLTDMQCVRDMTNDRTLFDIEVDEWVDGENIRTRHPVSQYAYASAYCLYLAGDQQHYLALSDFCSQLARGGRPNTTRALEALQAVIRTFPRTEQPATTAAASNLLLQNLPANDPAAALNTLHFQPPAAPLAAIAEDADEPAPAARANRRQRRLGLQRR